MCYIEIGRGKSDRGVEVWLDIDDDGVIIDQ